MSILRRGKLGAALLLTSTAMPLTARAAAVDASVAKGKKLIYVYNQTKLEKAKAAVPPPADPKRIPTLEKWRSNDLKVVAYLQTLGFSVTGNDESSPALAAAGSDLIVISESVDALDISTKYRNIAIPLSQLPAMPCSSSSALSGLPVATARAPLRISVLLACAIASACSNTARALASLRAPIHAVAAST